MRFGGYVMNFDEIFKIMDESFPNNEIRTYEAQKKLLDNDKYNIYVKKNESDSIIGFLAYWNLKNCTFFEHLAVSKKFRGNGVGKEIILENAKNVKKPIFFEVELPNTDIAQRRINFYKRLGFNLNEFYYEQPALRKNEKPQQMLIMSYPEPIDEQNFVDYKKEIYDNVYCKTI